MDLCFSNYLESWLISVDGNEVLATRNMSSTAIVYYVMRTGLPALGELEKSKFALFQTEFFDSKLNTYRIQSRKFGFGLNIKCRKKYSKSLMCPYNPL